MSTQILTDKKFILLQKRCKFRFCVHIVNFTMSAFVYIAYCCDMGVRSSVRQLGLTRVSRKPLYGVRRNFMGSYM